MSLVIALSSTFIISYLLFTNKQYAIPFNKITIGIIILELFATVAAAFVSLYLELPLDLLFTPRTHLYILVENIFTVGFIEELAKFIAVYIATARLTKLRRHEDLMFYLILSACSFAALENSLYMFIYEMDLTLAFMRSLISAPCHIVYSTIFSFFYTQSLEKTAKKSWLFLQALFFSSLFHGFMNFCLGYYDDTQHVLGILIVIFMFPAYLAISLVLVKNHFHRLFCTYCLEPLVPGANFCIYCGMDTQKAILFKNGKYLIYAVSSLIGIFLCLLFLL